MAVSVKTLESIKQRSLSELIELTGAKLKRNGREYVSLCIWHDDTNPSLTINDDKGFCFCHACRNGGDHIDFLQQRYGLTFFDAAEKAAQIYGISFETDEEDPEEARRKRQARQKVIDSLEELQIDFFRTLWDHKAQRIRNILQARGISNEAIDEFGIGFAKDGFFERRITIPIRNHKNELVGFTGRATLDSQDQKYKNSKTSEIFDKKKLVFNEVRGREAARESGSLVFVEGHLDVVSMWQAGIKNVVAIQGTGAPDPSVLIRLAKGISSLILCFDGDAGGETAIKQFMTTAGPLSLQGLFNVQIARLPDGMDPDEVIREKGGASLYNYICKAEPWLDRFIDDYGQTLDRTDTRQMSQVERELRHLVNQMTSEAVKSHYIRKISLLLAPDEKGAQGIAKEWGKIKIFSEEKIYKAPDVHRMRLLAERRLLKVYVHHFDRRERLQPLLEAVQSPPLRWLVKRIKELEEHMSDEFNSYDLWMVVTLAGPSYVKQLDKILDPGVDSKVSDRMVDHLIHVLESETVDLGKVSG